MSGEVVGHPSAGSLRCLRPAGCTITSAPVLHSCTGRRYEWDVLDPSAPFAIDATMTVQRDPGAFETRYYWSHYIWFSDAVPAPGATLTDGPAAYLGLQTWGATARGLIFSVWNGASGRPGAAGSIKTECKQFSHEGLGTQCFTAFQWQAGVPYRFRVSLLSRQASGDTLRAELTDLRPGGVTQGMGDISVPAYYGRQAAWRCRAPVPRTSRPGARRTQQRPTGWLPALPPLPCCLQPLPLGLFLRDIQQGGQLCHLQPGAYTVQASLGSLLLPPLSAAAQLLPHPSMCSNLRMKSGIMYLKPYFTSAVYPTNYPCPGWVGMDVCGTNVTGAGPLTAPVNPSGSSTRNRRVAGTAQHGCHGMPLK